MSANQRGCRSLIITLAVIVGIALFQIWFLPKVLGTGVTLPVITVPPEKYLENWPNPALDDFFCEHPSGWRTHGRHYGPDFRVLSRSLVKRLD